ncbi:hypothetical protein [Rhizobium herbae]|uniref:Uncharacterized protein n=1 Tax=Rhizobium herbae TaxID=508661 RepID=A0ABS4EK75_9HYPH|nr:hypothetical protein [Rhizobium herbae]MBP1858318.1 hypothetical protein [Rhizobium herbae]
MVSNRRLTLATARALVIATGVLASLLVAPQLALADRGSSHGEHSGDSDSGGHGSDDSGDSGSSSHGGSDGDDDRSGSGGKDGNEPGREDSRRSYEGGWRAQIKNGRYEVFDPAGRLVIRRKAKSSDYGKF